MFFIAYSWIRYKAPAPNAKAKEASPRKMEIICETSQKLLKIEFVWMGVSGRKKTKIMIRDAKGAAYIPRILRLYLY